MKYGPTLFLTLAIALATAFSAARAQSPAIESGVLVVKFAPNSATAANWFANQRGGSIEGFTPLLGAHTTQGYISDATLQAVEKRLRDDTYKKTSNMVSEMSHICVVRFTSAVDIAIAARKLSAFPDVLYAEPMPTRSTTFVPDDPLRFEQYHLNLINAFEAWDLAPAGSSAVIAIIDTGIDYLHEDLSNNIFINAGEDINHNGIVDDADFNNKDDDGNGFIDDIRGWDFIGATGKQGDNNPRPGNQHGTHVAGIAGATVNNAIGIAGTAPNVQLLPVKIAIDNSSSTSVINGYEGIIYAAAMGADIINCSWGGTTRSSAEEEIVANALALGSLIIGAAGNDSKEVAFFPASYPGVLSVASVNNDNRASGFSNFHTSVDVSAPGSSIYSTVPNNRYDYLSGTSMASPVTAGLAALIKMKNPAFKPLQIGEQIKATTDNIDTSLLDRYRGKFGTGRINALRALQIPMAKSALILSYTERDANANTVLEPGERVSISLNVLNVLAPIQNARLTASIPSQDYVFPFENNTVVLGTMDTYEQRSTPSSALVFTIPDNIPANYPIELQLVVEEDSGVIGQETLLFTLNPTYRTLRGNNITATFNSIGNIGFNDYPTNIQGEGFRYKESANFLYEGGLMIATSPNRISNVVRNAQGEGRPDNSFLPTSIIDVKNPGSVAFLEGKTAFRDQQRLDEAGVRVHQTIHQFNTPDAQDCIFLVYDVTNISDADFSSLYVGLYCDWDIGLSGANDITRFSTLDNMAYVYNTKNSSLPFIGMQLHSQHDLNYFAIDNDGSTALNPGVYDGYTRNEKWLTLSSGLGRKVSNITDVSTVISAGPIALKRGETTKVSFSICAGSTFEQLRTNAANARAVARTYDIGHRELVIYPLISEFAALYPNPLTSGDLSVQFLLADKQEATLQLSDILGKTIYTRTQTGKIGANTWTIPADIMDSLSTGTYFIQFLTADAVTSLPLRILR